ncbi:MAG: molybdopterin cofactor-binding domain-containing protein [Sphingomicrobium sp.]
MKFRSPDIDRRTLFIGGGLGVGLVVALAAWPRVVGGGLRARDREAVLGPFLKVASSGRITLAVPQAETGQGIWTGLAQIVADELGARWEQMAVEPAPSSPLYANPLIDIPGLKPWTVRETRARLRVTAGSTSIRAFEAPLRTAAAMARVMLIAAAAEKWNVPAAECDTADGDVIHESKRLGFGALAGDAAGKRAPEVVTLRAAGTGKLAGQPLPRLDLPPKSDGSLRFAADIRLPGMVFASLRMAPPGGRLTGFANAPARRVPGVRDLVVTDRWLAAIGDTWTAAERALAIASPRFTGPGGADSPAIAAQLNRALDAREAATAFERGDYASAVANTRPLVANYSIAPGQHFGLEPLCATARFTGDRLEVWAPSQASEFARAAAAAEAKLPLGQVVLYPMAVGSDSGRALEADAVPIAVSLARRVGRPVQLTIPASAGTNHDRLRPPLVARLAALPAPGGGTIAAWNARIVTSPGLEGALARLASTSTPVSDVSGAIPPYGIPAIRIDRIDVPPLTRTGYLRGGFPSLAGFVTESFIDEVARALGAEPLAFRIGMLGGNVRLAKAIMTACAIGQWDGGGSGSTMGIACASAFGSHIGLLAQAHIGPDQRIVVDRLVAAVDCGRVVNPDLVRQQIEGGLLSALQQATIPAPEILAAMPRSRPLRSLGLNRLAATPKIEVELIPSTDAPGGVSGLASTVLAASLANALAAGPGRRLRTLPFDLRSA